MVTVTGSSLTKFNRRKDGSNFRDWAYEAFDSSLNMAGIEKKDIDTLIIASESDFFTLQLNPSSILADDLGLFGVQTMRLEGGGASGQLAVHAGVMSILSGMSKHVAVIGVDPSASQLPAENIKHLYGFSFDAWTDGINNVTPSVLYALSYKLFLKEKDLSETDLADLTINNRRNACKNPNAHLPIIHKKNEIFNSQIIASPYRRLHCSPLSDGAASVILSDSKFVPEARKMAPKISGIGSASDRSNLGSRKNPGLFSAKSDAMKKACKMANIKSNEIGVAEVYDPYAGAQFQSVQALNLSKDIIKDFREGTFNFDGKIPINLSGGLLGQGAPAGAIGVGQTATCSMILEGRYHSGLQMNSVPKYALADTHGGIATTCSVSILESSIHS